MVENFALRPVSAADRAWIVERISEWWAAPVIVSRGGLHRPAELDGFIAALDGRPAGLVTLDVEGDQCEVVTLNSVEPGRGIGSALMEAAEGYARDRGCRRLWLITTNDKARALRFYQRRGFRVVARRTGAIDEARRLKPEISLTGEDGMPIHDEIELALELA